MKLSRPYATVLQGSRVRSSGQPREGYYLEDGRTGRNKSSPYHHAAARVAAAAAARGDPAQHPDYYRQQQPRHHLQQQQYEAEQYGMQHISDSRSDLLDHDHNAIYNFGSATTGFISCDGKFIPIPLPPNTTHAQQSYEIVPSAADYRRAAATHSTLGRRSKRSSLATDSGYGSCCPRDAHGGRNGRGSGSSGSSAAPMYATLRMRAKKDGRHGASNGGGAGAAGSGVGDNYGRNQFAAAASVYADDSRSLAGFTDDDFLLPPPHGHHEALLVTPGGGGGGARIMSRSTDRNLHHHHHHPHGDLGGGEDDSLQVMAAATGMAGPVRLASTASDQFLHEREPPDGKEKPEPACKTGKEGGGGMATLSRKSSKSDILDPRQPGPQPTSSSEAASMSGAESGGGKGDVGGGNRDSLSGAVMKDVVFQMEHSAAGGADQQDRDGGGAAYPGATEW